MKPSRSEIYFFSNVKFLCDKSYYSWKFCTLSCDLISKLESFIDWMSAILAMFFFLKFKITEDTAGQYLYSSVTHLLGCQGRQSATLSTNIQSPLQTVWMIQRRYKKSTKNTSNIFPYKFFAYDWYFTTFKNERLL